MKIISEIIGDSLHRMKEKWEDKLNIRPNPSSLYLTIDKGRVNSKVFDWINECFEPFWEMKFSYYDLTPVKILRTTKEVEK